MRTPRRSACPGTTSYVGFQESPGFVAPVWPPEAGAQQMQVHLDIAVDDLDAAAADAIELGATLLDAEHDGLRVLTDPAGHPFCLYFDPELGSPPEP